MFLKSLLCGTVFVAVVLAAAHAASLPAPGLKFIHVREALSRLELPNPPLNEDAAAGLSDRPNALPRVIRLRRLDLQLDRIKMVPGVRSLLDGFERVPR